ncbi:MAG: 3'-5' exonuclease [Anaerolineales bacterium]|nr:3'-5' exonuclease [Anaerolineales bacterium]
MNDNALVKAIAAALETHSDGLVEREIRQAVLQATGLRRRPPEIRQTLEANRGVFVGPLANGRWRLKVVIETEEIVSNASDAEQIRQERGRVVTPLLAHLPQLSAFIAFDLETTGINPERDQIIQISAVRMVDGQPTALPIGNGEWLTAIFNEYVRLEGRELPYGLKVKLGFTDHPEWEETLQQADSLREVLHRFRLWAGQMPLVAHNARFDHSFLQQAAATIDWYIAETALVDTMELACLARPDLDSFRLEALAKIFGIAAGESGGAEVEAWAKEQGVVAFSWTGFHNAVVDVLVLAALLPRLLSACGQRFTQQPGLAWLLHVLLPHLATQLGVPPTEDVDDVAGLIKQLVTMVPVTAVPPLTPPYPLRQHGFGSSLQRWFPAKA